MTTHPPEWRAGPYPYGRGYGAHGTRVRDGVLEATRSR